MGSFRQLLKPTAGLALWLLSMMNTVLAEGLEPAAMAVRLMDRPQTWALVVYGVQPDGTPDPRQPSVLVNPDEPMPLASIRKIIILAAYARAVEQGRLNPDARVALAEWERYYLPSTDGGAHPQALKRLTKTKPEPNDGKAPRFTLDQLANAMMRESDNAAADYLLATVGDEAVRQVIAAAGLTRHDPLAPILGEFLLYASADLPAGLDRDEFHRRATRLAAERAQEGTTLREPSLPGAAEQARRVAAFTVRGTAREYADILARVMTGHFISREVSRVMRRHLEWPMDAHPQNARVFEVIGAKGGSLPGVLGNALYFQPRVGPARGQRKVAVLLMRDLHPSDSRLFMTAMEDFMLNTAVRADFAEWVRETVDGHEIR